jgi:hypothetical protein
MVLRHGAIGFLKSWPIFTTELRSAVKPRHTTIRSNLGSKIVTAKG